MTTTTQPQKGKESMKTQEIIEVKANGKWTESNVVNDVTEVYRRLSNDLINKKLNGATYIRSIRRTPLYNGFQKIVVFYDNNVRSTYIVENH